MTDERIVDLFFERSEKAIEETDKAYGRYFHYIAVGILGDDEDAKEIVNDTYLKAWNCIPPARPNPLKAFLGRMTRQLSLNRLEQKNAQKRKGEQRALVLDELSECISGTGISDIEDTVALTEALNRFLRLQPIPERRVFIRRYWYMASVADIAKEFKMSESKVKTLLFRQRQKLHKQLKEEGFDV